MLGDSDRISATDLLMVELGRIFGKPALGCIQEIAIEKTTSKEQASWIDLGTPSS